MSVALEVAGGRGEARSFDGEFLLASVDSPIAPGTPLRIELGIGEGLSVEARCVGSRRQPDGSYEVRFRLVSLRREARLVIRSTLPS